MKKGNKIYTSHMIILFALGGVFALAPEAILSNRLIFITIFIVFFIYFLLFIFGSTFGMGPLKYIAKSLMEDHQEELDKLKPKKPWE